MKYQQIRNVEEGSINKCPSCFENGNQIQMFDECEHGFCEKCVKNMKKNSNKLVEKKACPLCTLVRDDKKEYFKPPSCAGTFGFTLLAIVTLYLHAESMVYLGKYLDSRKVPNDWPACGLVLAFFVFWMSVFCALLALLFRLINGNEKIILIKEYIASRIPVENTN